MLVFRKIALEDRDEFLKHFQACPEKTADYCFTNLWAWKDKYQTEISFEDGLCWLRQKEGEEYVYVSPIGDWENTYWQDLIPSYFEKGFSFHKIPEKLAFQLDLDFPMLVNLEADRDNWEYNYKISELVSLSGTKFRNQRKLVRQFKENYNYTFKFIEKSDLKAVKVFQKDWLEQNQNNEQGFDLKQENKAINNVLDNWQSLGDKLFGSVLLVNNDVVAYCIAEELDDQTIIIHFEKASFECKGAYQAINQMTLESLKDYTYVNREQDLGLLGLREAKMRYNPSSFIRKYNVTGYFLITAKEKEDGIFKNCCHTNIASVSLPDYLPLY